MPETENSIVNTGGVPQALLNVEGNGIVQTPVDATLSIENMAADAKATGEAIQGVQSQIDTINETLEADYVKLSAQEMTAEQQRQVQANLGIIDLIYPVGSVFICTTGVNPNSQFANTTWQMISGRFLVGAGANYPLGSMGGQENYPYTPSGTVSSTVLTAAQSGLRRHSHDHTLRLPNHTHTFQQGSVTSGSVKVSEATIGSFSGGEATTVLTVAMGGNATSGLATATPISGEVGQSESADCTGSISPCNPQDATEGHTHTFNGTTALIPTVPPYLAVNMWQRTA